MTQQEASVGTARTLEEELLRALARQTRRVPIPVFLATLMIAALAAQKVPVAAWGGWLLLVAITLVVRRTVLWRLPRLTGYTDQEKLRIAILLNVANGVVHGLSLLFIPFLPEFERAIQSMILVGLCAGAVATNVGYMPVLLGYLVPTLPPLALMWALSPGIAEVGWIERSTAILIVLFGFILVALGRDAFRLFRESFAMRLEQADLNRRLQAALERAEDANRAKTRFLAAASHDLRQPIHTLSLFGAALAMCNLDARTREISQNINVALQGMASQFDALLDISKLDAGVVHSSRALLEPRRLVERLVREFEPVAHAKDLAMTASCPFEGMVETDRLLLERIVRNLIDNAIKYTDAGSIHLAVTAAGDEAVLAVTDTGRGIPPSEHARVFEEFYQLDNPERDRTRGFGLGLSIVKRLADLLGIRIEMESAPGKGTTFRLHLPATRRRRPGGGFGPGRDDERRRTPCTGRRRRGARSSRHEDAARGHGLPRHAGRRDGAGGRGSEGRPAGHRRGRFPAARRRQRDRRRALGARPLPGPAGDPAVRRHGARPAARGGGGRHRAVAQAGGRRRPRAGDRQCGRADHGGETMSAADTKPVRDERRGADVLALARIRRARRAARARSRSRRPSIATSSSWAAATAVRSPRRASPARRTRTIESSAWSCSSGAANTCPACSRRGCRTWRATCAFPPKARRARAASAKDCSTCGSAPTSAPSSRTASAVARSSTPVSWRYPTRWCSPPRLAETDPG